MPSERDWLRLGQTVRQRRERLRLPQGAGGVSSATWRKVEKAIEPPYAPRTVSAICDALGWRVDSFDRILSGDDPMEVDAPPGDRPPLEQAYSELAAEVRRLTERVRQLENERAQSS